MHNVHKGLSYSEVKRKGKFLSYFKEMTHKSFLDQWSGYHVCRCHSSDKRTLFPLNTGIHKQCALERS